MELIHALALAHLVSLPAPTTFAHRLPQPTRLPIARSRGFHHAWGTTRWSDDSTRTTPHFACAYRVASLGALRERFESSWGHVLVFHTVPSANTLIRWWMRTPSPPYCRLDLSPPLADRFVFGVAPIDYGPVLLRKPFGFHLTVDTLPSGVRGEVASGPPWLCPAFAFVPV
jgi:hypothetical protein